MLKESWRSSRAMLEEFWRITGEHEKNASGVIGKYWRSSDKAYKSITEILEKYWRIIRKALERYQMNHRSTGGEPEN